MDKILKFLHYIWNFLKSFSLREWILMLVAAFAIVSAIQIYFTNRTKIVALETQCTTYKNKANEEYLAKTILIQDVKDLKKTNDSLYAEYKNVKKEDPLIITKTKLETRIDTLKIPTIIEKTIYGGTVFKWNYSEFFNKNNYLHINGRTQTDSLISTAETYLDSFEMGADLTLDVVKSEADNALKIITRTNNPHLSITNVEGVVLNPSKNDAIKSFFPPKRWGLGIGIGVGTGYDVNTKRFTVGPQLTVGINYNLLNW